MVLDINDSFLGKLFSLVYHNIFILFFSTVGVFLRKYKWTGI